VDFSDYAACNPVRWVDCVNFALIADHSFFKLKNDLGSARRE